MVIVNIETGELLNIRSYSKSLISYTFYMQDGTERKETNIREWINYISNKPLK